MPATSACATSCSGESPKGEDLKCALTKTWTKSTLKEADQRDVKWDFGDARCTVQININRAAVVAALAAGEYQILGSRPHRQLHRRAGRPGQDRDGDAGAQDRLQGGKADKIWINLLNVEGPTGIKATLSTAARLNDSIGLFHRAMLKSVNGYIYKHCPKYHPLTQATAAPAKPAPAKPAAAPAVTQEGRRLRPSRPAQRARISERLRPLWLG